MARTVVLNKQADETKERIGNFMSGDQFELYLNIEDYQKLEDVIHTLFDEDSVRRIKAAMAQRK